MATLVCVPFAIEVNHDNGKKKTEIDFGENDSQPSTMTSASLGQEGQLAPSPIERKEVLAFI